MNIKPIRNDDDLRAAFQRLELVFQAQAGTPEEDEMEILVTLIEAYEHKHFPIDPADQVDAIKFRLEQQGCMNPRERGLPMSAVKPETVAPKGHPTVSSRPKAVCQKSQLAVGRVLETVI